MTTRREILTKHICSPRLWDIREGVILQRVTSWKLGPLRCTFVSIDAVSYQVKLFMFYNVQTTNLSFVSRIQNL